MRTLLPAAVLAALTVPLHAQSSGRTMQVLAPTVLGQTATFGLTHPASAAGNPYAFLWCMPPFAGTQTLSVPGLAVQGLLRVSPVDSVAAYHGVLGAGGSVVHSLVIPNHPSFLGMVWDLQSMDVAVASWTLSLADNDLSLRVVGVPPAYLNMVPIAAGTFLMGSPEPVGQPPNYNQAISQPVHAVTISRSFWIGRFEVTQSQYEAVMGVNPSIFQGTMYPNSGSRPVEFVSYFHATSYCQMLTLQEAAAGRLPAGYVYRLPSEAEWEYCCRAGTSTEFHGGSSLFCGQANFRQSSPPWTMCTIGVYGETIAVGSYAPNAWGLHDMHGNVWEWCLDAWNGSTGYPAGAVTDPLGTGVLGGARRGGGYDTNHDGCRAAYRLWSNPAARNNNVGFRVVLAPVLP